MFFDFSDFAAYRDSSWNSCRNQGIDTFCTLYPGCARRALGCRTCTVRISGIPGSSKTRTVRISGIPDSSSEQLQNARVLHVFTRFPQGCAPGGSTCTVRISGIAASSRTRTVRISGIPDSSSEQLQNPRFLHVFTHGVSRRSTHQQTTREHPRNAEKSYLTAFRTL